MSSLSPIRPEDVLRRASAIGNYYGFSAFPTLAAAARSTRPAREPYPKGISPTSLDSMAQTVASFLKQARDAGMTPSLQQPLFVWHTNITPGRMAPKQAIVQFHAIGAPGAIADGVLMRAAHAFVADLLKTKPELRINSLGDKETRARYSREIGNFFRRNGAELPSDCLACAKRDVFEAVETLISRANIEGLPSSIDHLSEASRKHFENVLEFLEDTDTPYALAPELISRANAWTETCFEIRAGDERTAWGSRYGELTTPFFKTLLPSAAVVVRVPTHRTMVPVVRELGKPRVVFLHIGDEAKRTSVRLADDLRRARLPLTQMIGVESLTEQMRIADKLKPNFMLIMGRKEALEGTAILRERATHVETILPIESLVDDLRAAIA